LKETIVPLANFQMIGNTSQNCGDVLYDSIADVFTSNSSGEILLNQTAVNMTFNHALVYLNNSAKDQIVETFGSLQDF